MKRSPVGKLFLSHANHDPDDPTADAAADAARVMGAQIAVIPL